MKEELIRKYNVPVPRYTSYPTAPCWGDDLDDINRIEQRIQTTFQENNTKNGVSLYVHLPYCESLCTFCACTRVIMKNHNVEDRYIDAVLKEWQKYLNLFQEKPIIRELHLGGGTPTFFSAENLKRLISGILKEAVVHSAHEFSFEAHPGVTNRTHLEVLHELGFNRVSFGIQDFDEKVQETINRKNDFQTVKEITEAAREIGYTSINFDLVYGLPKQQLSSVEDSIRKVAKLRPERIAFYSYAHVPWKMKMQRTFTEEDLPNNAAKRALYEKGKELLKANGYFDIGLDHFSLKNDELFKAYEERRLHRNFMGYNTSHTQVLIGLGASSISDFDTMYIQNEKHVKNYEKTVESGDWAYQRSYILTDEDFLIKRAILDISCKRNLQLTEEFKQKFNDGALMQLEEMESEGLLDFQDNTLQVTDLGMVFLRNICSVFDKNYTKNKPTTFSKSI